MPTNSIIPSTHGFEPILKWVLTARRVAASSGCHLEWLQPGSRGWLYPVSPLYSARGCSQLVAQSHAKAVVGFLSFFSTFLWDVDELGSTIKLATWHCNSVNSQSQQYNNTAKCKHDIVQILVLIIRWSCKHMDILGSCIILYNHA